ncbi:MAG: hypothetical protein COA50_09915 [Flavobacteriaceae bacterium]|nr:MAG: hypothetical protein COA50_09915 [Flavobacteriaceae bacterium]
MNIKIIYFLLFCVVFVSCDPTSEKSLIVRNDSAENLELIIHGKSKLIFNINAIGGDFGLIGSYDSILIKKQILLSLNGLVRILI